MEGSNYCQIFGIESIKEDKPAGGKAVQFIPCIVQATPQFRCLAQLIQRVDQIAQVVIPAGDAPLLFGKRGNVV